VNSEDGVHTENPTHYIYQAFDSKYLRQVELQVEITAEQKKQRYDKGLLAIGIIFDIVFIVLVWLGVTLKFIAEPTPFNAALTFIPLAMSIRIMWMLFRKALRYEN
jgi:hypothetical protein